MSQGKILYALIEGKCFIKMSGDIRWPISAGFDVMLNKFMLKGEAKEFIVDLNETFFIDSTNLGLLAKIARYCMEKKSLKPVIFSINEEVNIILESVGFEDFFTILKKTDNSLYELKEISQASKSEREKIVMTIEAHKALMELNEKNRDVFSDVVDLLQKNIKQPEE